MLQTIKTETVSVDGVLNSVQVPPSATPSSGPDGVAMETSSAGGDGRVVVSFVTKMDIASEGKALCHLNKHPCTCTSFQGVNLAASIQKYGSTHAAKIAINVFN